MTILGGVMVLAVLLVVVYLVRESGETVSRSPLAEDPIDYQTQGRPCGVKSQAWYAPRAKMHVLRCLVCKDELDLDLHGQEPEARSKAANHFWTTHQICQNIHTDNKTQKQGAPGG